MLHAAPGRGVERVVLSGRTVALKWRHDRATDREALLYQTLTPAVTQALGCPRPLGAVTIGSTHLLFLEWVEGTRMNWRDPHHVHLAFTHLGRLHRTTAALIAQTPRGLASGEAYAELFPEPYPPGQEPLVLDPGDLHADNFLLTTDDNVHLLDFENMAVRPRAVALRQLRDDPSLPRGSLADLALSAYWRAAGWRDDGTRFRARVLGG